MKDKVADGRTEREKFLEEQNEKLQEYIKHLEIENSLMKELLSRPVTYTYGIR